MAHIGAHGVEPVMAHHLTKLDDAFLIRCNLCLEVGNVLSRVTRRVGGLGQKLEDLLLAKAALRNELERIDIDSFLLDASRSGTHRARCDPADVSVMPARGDKKEKVRAILAKYRRDHGDVGEMCPAIIGRI